MYAESPPIRKCAVCGIMAPESTDGFQAEVSSNRMSLDHAGESHALASSGPYLCSEEHAKQFVVTWLFCDDGRTESAALPHSNEFRLRSTDAAMEFSLAMAIQAFWDEGSRATEGRSLRQCINF